RLMSVEASGRVTVIRPPVKDTLPLPASERRRSVIEAEPLARLTLSLSAASNTATDRATPGDRDDSTPSTSKAAIAFAKSVTAAVGVVAPADLTSSTLAQSGAGSPPCVTT